MANAPNNVSKWLAENLLLLRTKRNLTQQALARLSGVPRSTITYLESSEGNPSLFNLVKISAALQVSIEELLVAPRSSCVHIKAGAHPATKRAHGKATVFELLPDPIPGMQIDRMEMEAGARIGGVPHLGGTKEYFTCVEGRVQITVAGECFDVQVGDVLAFLGDRPHAYHNSGTRKAVGISVVVLAHIGV